MVDHLTIHSSRHLFPARLNSGVTTSENVSLAADMVKQAIKTGQSVL
jgi:hypothetical protein